MAKPRTTLAKRGKGETFSLPNRATKNARMAATVVADMARARVTTTNRASWGIKPATVSTHRTNSTPKKAMAFLFNGADLPTSMYSCDCL